MNITFVSYLDPFAYPGGGEMALRAAIEHGRRRGHRITVLSRRNGKFSRMFAPALTRPPETELYILADVFNCPEDHLPLDFAFLRSIVEHEPFIHWDNAWVDVCARPALPCHGRRENCPDACGLERARWLYSRALACVFVSPLHARTTEQLLGEGVVPRRIVARPMVNTELFFNRRAPRDIDFLCVGTIARFKGYDTVRQLLSGENLWFIGPNATGEPVIGRHIPHVAHEDLPRYYNRAKTFVHLPEWIEPQGRTVVEAALCGCALMTNERVGAMSFPFNIADPAEIRVAPDLLWAEIEQVACGEQSARATRSTRQPTSPAAVELPR